MLHNILILLSFFLTFITILKQFFSSHKKIKLFVDNGVRINLVVSLDKWKKTEQKIDCSETSLIPCKIKNSFSDCVLCGEILASCIHFSSNENVVDKNNKFIRVIPKNESLDDGYCLRLNDKEKRICSEKNGGKWILSKMKNNQFSYVCYCTTPNVFDNSSLYTDCNEFKGCLNGKLNSNIQWNSFNEIRCDCDEGYSEVQIDNQFVCQRNNYFKINDEFNEAIAKNFIDKNYRGYHLTLPNPCIIDARTGKIDHNAGKLVLENNIAYCVPLSNKYTTIIFNDDYLIGNGGKYANAIYSVSTIEDKNLKQIFETHTRRKNGQYYPIFKGYIHKLENIIPKIEYLEHDSINIAGAKKFLALIKYKSNAKVYVYEAETPNFVSMPIGTHITYLPTFTYHLEAGNKNFQGLVAYRNFPIKNCDTLTVVNLWTGLWATRYNNFPLEGMIAGLKQDYEKDHIFVNNYSGTPFCKTNNISGPNIYSAMFTGLYSNEYEDNQGMKTVIISAGSFLTNLYRKQVDPEWRNFKINHFEYISEPPLQPVGNFCAGKINDAFDCDGISMPPSKLTRYKCQDLNFQWIQKYGKT